MLNEPKTCVRCKAPFPATPDYFHRDRNRPDGLQSYCKSCRNSHQMVYDRNLILKTSTAYARRLRLQVLEAYGGTPPSCACCGVAHLEFLAIDHVGGGGNAHRKAIGATKPIDMCRWLKRNGFPPGFRVLCHNCNSALGHYGYCPHGLLPGEDAPLPEDIPTAGVSNGGGTSPRSLAVGI